MKYFVLRNMTIEPLFQEVMKRLESSVSYSGYEDISDLGCDSDRLIWWYLAPYKAEIGQSASEIINYGSLLQLALNSISSTKTVIAITIESIFEVNCVSSKSEIKLAVSRYNNFLYELAEEYKNLKVVDICGFTRNYSRDQLIDWKYYFISQMALNPRLAKDFGKWFAAEIIAIEMNRKKCLVLDLDNTLWGGVVGEDGIHGVKIGGDYPGNAYLYFQRYILELARQGVILAVCSKNNLDDVKQLWHNNSNNLITDDNLSAFRINWQDKATNITEIAKELNIGVDSIVFVDDNPTERELVKGMLPEVSVVDFPAQPYGLPAMIENISQQYFKIYSLTNEDTAKVEQYKANAQRNRVQGGFSNMDDYIRSLEIVLSIDEISSSTIERVAQLTQKTNQFNLTTKRYTQSDIEHILRNGGVGWTLNVSDKFGDSGITGVLIAKLDGNSANIDTLLLSCRVLGKDIETAFVNEILGRLLKFGISKVIGVYIPTLKNGQVANFYSKLGFVQNNDVFEINIDKQQFISDKFIIL